MWDYDKVPVAIESRALAQNNHVKILAQNIHVKILESKDAISRRIIDMASFDSRIFN